MRRIAKVVHVKRAFRRLRMMGEWTWPGQVAALRAIDRAGVSRRSGCGPPLVRGIQKNGSRFRGTRGPLCRAFQCAAGSMVKVRLFTTAPTRLQPAHRKPHASRNVPLLHRRGTHCVRRRKSMLRMATGAPVPYLVHSAELDGAGRSCRWSGAPLLTTIRMRIKGGWNMAVKENMLFRFRNAAFS